MSTQATSLEPQPATARPPVTLADLKGAPGVAAPAAGQDTPEGPAAADRAALGIPEEASVALFPEAGPPEEGIEAAHEGEESSLSPTAGETDYSPEVYARYAQHFSRQFKVNLDPNDPAHRALLRETIQRGEAIKRMRGEARAEVSEAAPAEPPPPQDTPEQVQQFLQTVQDYAKSMVRPEVAQHLWERLRGARTAEDYAQFMTSAGILFLNDFLPRVLPDLVQQYVLQSYPLLGSVHDQALLGRAVESLEGRKDPAGLPLFSDLGELLENGGLERVFTANPWIRQGRYTNAQGRPLGSLENAERQIEIAVKLARGEQVNPALVKKAVETGKKQAAHAAQVARASKLAAGESKGQFGQPENALEEKFQRLLELGDHPFARGSAPGASSYRSFSSR